MKYRNITRHSLFIAIALTASYLQAATTYSLKYNTWELIAVPNPIPFAINSPMKMFGKQIEDISPNAKYGPGGDWIMWSYDSEKGGYVLADLKTAYEPGKGYWAIQAVSVPGDTIKVDVVTRYNLGDTGPAGGIVFYIDPVSGGTSGLEAAPEDQSTNIHWCSSLLFDDIEDVINVNTMDPDVNSGSFNTPLITAACDLDSAAGVAGNYVWPEGHADGFLPNREQLNLLHAQRDLVGDFSNPGPIQIYWSSSEYDHGSAWYQIFSDSDGWQNWSSKSNYYNVRAIRDF